jgi:hypothetical protein
MVSMFEVWMDSLLAKKIRSYGWRGEVETESAVIAARDRILRSKYHGTKIVETETVANAESVISFIRQWKTSHQHAQHGQKKDTYRDMIVYVLNCTLTYARK